MPAISILASADHGNVTSVMTGQTPQLVGYNRGTIPLALQVKGTPVDCSTYTTLRLDLSLTAMANRHGFENGSPSAASLHVTLEHAETEAGPWRVLHEFSPMRDLGTQHVVLSAFDGFVRSSHYFARHGVPSSTITDQVAFTFAITGTALTAAA